MGKATATKHYNNFSNGVISDGNEFSAPDNAVRYMLNMELLKDNSLRRRRGLSFDDSPALWTTVNAAFGTIADTTHAVVHHWNYTETTTDFKFALACLDNTAKVYRRESSGVLSATHYGTFALTDGTTLSSQNGYMSTASNADFLIATHPYKYPHIVEKNVGLNTYIATHFTPKVRDLDGVDDGWDVDYNPTASTITVNVTTAITAGEILTGASSGYKAVALEAAVVGTGKVVHVMFIGTTGFTNETVNGSSGGLATITAQTANDGLSEEKYYNLLNQGWTYDNILQYAKDTLTYPSNAQIMSAGKDASGNFSSTELDKVFFGNSPAPKGKTVLEAFTPDRTYTDPINGGTTTISFPVAASGFSAAALFAGRVVLAGGYSYYNGNSIYISQLITNKELDPTSETFLMDRFHSINDPTSEQLNGTLATDGTVINVADADRILDIVTLGKGLLIIATNGVWFLRGTDTGFSAESFELVKISSKEVDSPGATVAAEEFVAYFTKGGVEIATIDQTGFSVNVQSLTDNKYSEGYLAFDADARYSAVGYYDPHKRQLSWLLDDTNGTVCRRNKRLTFDLSKGAWIPYDYSVGQEYSGGAYYYPIGLTQRLVTASAENSTPELQFLVAKYDSPNTKVTAALENSRGFYDWSDNTAYFDSYVEPWAEHLGQPHIEKEVDSAIFFFRRTETQFVNNGSGGVEFDYPSSALVTPKWDWTGTDVGTWEDQAEMYRFEREYVPGGIGDSFDYGYDVIKTVNDVRGIGTALTFRFDADDGKDMHLLGYTVVYSGNVKVDQ